MASFPPSSTPSIPSAGHPPLDVQNARIPESLQGLPGMIHGARWEGISRTSTKSTQRAQRRRQQPLQTRPKRTSKSRRTPPPSGRDETSGAVHYSLERDNEAQLTHLPIDAASVDQPSTAFAHSTIDDTSQFTQLGTSSSSACTTGLGSTLSRFDLQWSCSTPSSTTSTSFGPDTPPAQDEGLDRYQTTPLSFPQSVSFPNMDPHTGQGVDAVSCPSEAELSNDLHNLNISHYAGAGADCASIPPGPGRCFIHGQDFGSSSVGWMTPPSSLMVFGCPRDPASAYGGRGMEDNRASFLFSPTPLADTRGPTILPLTEGPLQDLHDPFQDDTFPPNQTFPWANGRDQEPVVNHGLNAFVSGFYDHSSPWQTM